MLNYSANGPSGYNLTNSLRFRSSASAYLSRTPASAGNRKTFTWSAWIKRGSLATANGGLFGARGGSGAFNVFQFTSSDTLQTYSFDGSTFAFNFNTTQVFRDPSAWYHIIFAFDTTQATSTNRVKIYVNGSQITAFSTATYPSQNFDTAVNSTIAHFLGVASTSDANYLDGYMDEINFIDGQALTPSSFGSFNSITGVWQPAKYTGTYGTNGFYLNFTDIALTSGSNTGLGRDFSGNGNYWNTNNISVTSGTTYDAMTDVPTLTSATVANYAVMNPLNNGGTLSNANLTFVGTTKGVLGTFGLESGQFYWETTITASSANDNGTGIMFNGATAAMRDGTAAPTFNVVYQGNGNVRKNNNIVATYATFTVGDIIGIAYNANTLQITFYKNNVSQGTITADTPTSSYMPHVFQPAASSATININFGQRPFSYTPPTGFVALNTFNLPTSTIVKGNTVMDATLYTGNNTTNNVVNAAGFQPDLIWLKCRSVSPTHPVLIDSVRGVSNGLASDLTNAEFSTVGNFNSINSNGFTTAGNTSDYNQGSATYVGWQWQAGQGSTSSNTSGSITSTVSVNTTAGFSIQTWTGTGANATVGHGLGVAPKMIIIKNRTSSWDWGVYHASLGATKYIYLNQTAAAGTSIQAFNNTEPTSSVFSVGTGLNFNNTATMVSYCWAEIAGFSKFGSYTGNGSTDGPFQYCGFRPRWIMWKRTSSTSSWVIWDTARNTYNAANSVLFPDTSDAESTNTAYDIDVLSNGFKMRTSNATMNGSGSTYIFAAFAENPFKNALAR